MAMNKNEAQLQEDYGVVLGQVGGIYVVGPAVTPTDGKNYVLKYDGTDEVFKISEEPEVVVGGVPIVADPDSLVDSTAYNLVYGETEGVFNVTAAS